MTFRTFGVAIALLVGASVGHAQGIQRSSDSPAQYVQSMSITTQPYGNGAGAPLATGPLYVACRAEAPSSDAAYFSDAFASHAPLKSRKAFRELVATRYGPVSRAHCAGNTSLTELEALVRQWKENARAATSAVVDTGWKP
jgi:hypothetical protein